jgi:hypothetical protein
VLLVASAVGAVDGDTNKVGDDVVVDVVEAEPPDVVEIASVVVVLLTSVEVVGVVVVVVVEVLSEPAIKVGRPVGPDV